MADDYDCYRVRHGDRHSTDGRHDLGRAGRVGRGARLLGDGRLAAFRTGTRAIRSGRAVAVLEIWTEELRYAHAHAPGGLVMVTVHPECIGRGHRMAMLERFIDTAAALEGVVFERLDAVVSRWSASGSGDRRNAPTGHLLEERTEERVALRPFDERQDDSASEDRVEHRRRQPAGERVLLARVVGAEQDVRSECSLRAVAEARLRSRSKPAVASARSAASHPKAPSATMTRTSVSSASSRTRNGAQVSRSSVVGLLAGGAQRTAAAM